MLFCNHQNCVTPIIPCIHIRPCLKQEPYDFAVTSPCRPHQGCPATGIACLQVSPSLQEELYDFRSITQSRRTSETLQITEKVGSTLTVGGGRHDVALSYPNPFPAHSNPLSFKIRRFAGLSQVSTKNCSRIAYERFLGWSDNL